MSEVRHVLGISGGKDSAALAIYLKDKYPNLHIEYYSSDTKCELDETIQFIDRLRSYLGHITTLIAAEGSPEPTPFDHFLKVSGGYLPSVQARWCTQKMKLAEFEKFVGDTPTVSYVGIRGDEDREGYVSTKPNIQAIFPFRKNIWSMDVIHEVLHDKNIENFAECYRNVADDETYQTVEAALTSKLTKHFYYSKKLNMLLDADVITFNHAVFSFLKQYRLSSCFFISWFFLCWLLNIPFCISISCLSSSRDWLNSFNLIFSLNRNFFCCCSLRVSNFFSSINNPL